MSKKMMVTGAHFDQHGVTFHKDDKVIAIADSRKLVKMLCDTATWQVKLAGGGWGPLVPLKRAIEMKEEFGGEIMYMPSVEIHKQV
jgi:hypothetical protein